MIGDEAQETLDSEVEEQLNAAVKAEKDVLARLKALEKDNKELKARVTHLEKGAVVLPEPVKTRKVRVDEGVSYQEIVSAPVKPVARDVGDGGPFKLKMRKFTGYTTLNEPMFRKVKEYGEWEQLGSFSSPSAAIAYISKTRNADNQYSVFMGNKSVYKI